MRKILTVVILSLFLSTAAFGEDVTSEQAENLALSFAREIATAESVWRVETYYDVNGEPIARAVTIAKNRRTAALDREFQRLLRTDEIDYREESYLTVVVAASRDLPPVIAYYDGLPADVIAQALLLRAGTAVDTSTGKVVYVSPFESYLRISSSGVEATYNMLDLRRRDPESIPEPEPLEPEHIYKNNRAWEKADNRGGALPASIEPAASKTISGVPDYNQPNDMPGSCGPTSAACVLGYWDAKGYPKLMQNGSYNLISELADAMNYLYNQGVYPDDIPVGLRTVANNKRGYSFNISIIYRVTLTQFKAEVDAGRPTCYGSYDNPWGGGHEVCGVGYNGDYIIVHDNWPSTPENYNVSWYSIGHSDDDLVKVVPGGGGGDDDGDDDGDDGGGSQGKVVSPTEGLQWKAGKRYRIQWSGFDSAKIKLELYRNSNRIATLKNKTKNDGKQRCKLPSGLADSDRYRVKVISYDDSSDFAFSGYFTIGNGGGGDDGDDNTGDGTVIKPNGNSLWWAGDTYEIKWSGLSGTQVSIELYSDWPAYHGTIVSSTANDGSYPWKIPWSAPWGFCYVVIKSNNGSQAISDYFTIW